MKAQLGIYYPHGARYGIDILDEIRTKSLRIDASDQGAEEEILLVDIKGNPLLLRKPRSVGFGRP